MLLTLDIGNSAVKGGLFDGSELEQIVSVEPPTDSSDRASEMLSEAFRPLLGNGSVDRIGIVSVVPSTTAAVTDVLRTLTDARLTHVGTDMALPFTLDYETPETLGTDRLAAAAAGWMLIGREEPRSTLVVDAGTAVNYEVIHRDGIYQGGAIAPGPALMQQTLHRGTAQLPSISLTVPDTPVGSTTSAALQSGIVWGFVDGVRGMIDRLSTSLPDNPLLVLTGGWSSLLAEHLDRVDHRSPHLVLEGTRLLTTMND